MGTGCRIGIYYASRIISTSVHWDGNLTGVGTVLQNYYNVVESKDNLEKIETLIQKGDLRYIESDTCLEYFPSCDSTMYKEDNDFISFYRRTVQNCGEYYYLYKHGDGWFCGDTYGSTPIMKLDIAISLSNEKI